MEPIAPHGQTILRQFQVNFVGEIRCADLGVELAHDVLDPGVILEAVAREVFAVSRALVSPVRHLCHQWNMGIDPDAAEIKGLSSM